MAGIGRISGPLLKDNLLRHGVDLSFETDLLYLNVNDERVGIKTDSPSRLLTIESDIKTTDLISDDYIRISSNIVFDNQDNITTDNSVLNLNSNFSINLVGFKTDRLLSNNNKISIDASNYDLNLIPTRDTILNSSLLVQGNLHANGNITLGGNITFGNNSNDEVVFDSEFTSNLMPDIDNTFDLGEELKRWNNVHVKDITVNNIYTRNLTAGALNLTYNFTNTIFVAVNGDDVTNRGNIFVSPYRSIAKALSEASAGDTIRIMPGEYEEDFPLTVPAGVSIVGENLRSVTVKPSAPTVFNDAFLLNGETTVTNITVKDFNYSNITESGYAFRFSSGAVITSRSPYIQNVTVITQETSEGAGDAGRGALVDGSAVGQTSNEASMLFHAVTFITPGSTALLVTNGSRVEWLSSFTYYANKGIHATQGTLGFAGQGVRFGAEIRSIASANVYGNQGVVADGADTLVYLINHNFGYIGNGYSYDNDQTIVNQEDEVIELNSGKVYYVSQSQDGDFRVGDAFLVDFNKGDVSFGNSNIILDNLSTIVFQGTGENRLYLRSGSIEIGDFNISGNTIETLSSDFNIDSFSGEINLLDNTLVDGNVLINGDFQTSGTISFGNQTTDTITFNTELEQDLLPDADNLYDLGSDSKRWKDIHTVIANTNNISISGNIIETTVVDSDLTLLSSGTGYVVLDSVYFKNAELSSTSGNSLIFSPATNKSVVINESTSLKIPYVPSNLTTSGELVLDSSSNIFQGYSSDLVNLGGVYSKDRRTQFFAHTTDDSFRFVANTTQTAILTSSALQASAISFADFNINNNILQSTDLSILIDSIDISNLNFQNQTITAPQNSVMTIVTSGIGYTVFNSTTALQIPNGTRQQASQSGVVGMTRFNAEDAQVESYNGEIWVPAGGIATEVVTESFVEEQITFWSLIVG